MKILFPLIVMVAFAFTAIGQQVEPQTPPTCGDPAITKTKTQFRAASATVKANTWLAQLVTLRQDGRRTPEQTAVLDEIIPYLTADLYDKKTTLPDSILTRAKSAFGEERWLLSDLGEDAKLYLASKTPLLTLTTASASLKPFCTCAESWGCPYIVGPYCGNLAQFNTCLSSIEGCGILWLSPCVGLCRNIDGTYPK